MSLNLRLRQPDSIELPNWLAATTLTLEELGAVVVAACLRDGADMPEMQPRLADPQLMRVVQGLVEKGVCKAIANGNTISIDFDLDSVTPPSVAALYEDDEDEEGEDGE